MEGPPPTITAYATDAAEAHGVAEALYRAHDPMRPWSSMAVLYRVNAQSAPFEEALNRAGVPYRVRGASAFLDRPEVKVVVEALRKGAKTAPGRTFAEHLTDLATDANELSEDRREHVDAVAALGREYLAAEGSTGSVKGFLDYLRASLRGGDDGGLHDDAVDLLTFHRAKGLEWDTVFVTGLERGFVPISHATGKPDAIDEERRLLYVALSRAERHLHLSWAKERARGARVSSRTKSPYLNEIARVIDDSPAEETSTDPARGPAGALPAARGAGERRDRDGRPPALRRAGHLAAGAGPRGRGAAVRDPRQQDAEERGHGTTPLLGRAPRAPRDRPGEAGALRRGAPGGGRSPQRLTPAGSGGTIEGRTG